MQYQGGKAKSAKKFAPILFQSLQSSNFDYFEPFVGGLNILPQLHGLGFEGQAWLSDANSALIAIWQAVKNGWEPPDNISKADYENAKLLPDSDPSKAFILIAQSYGGKWAGGYAKNHQKQNYTNCAIKGIAKKRKCLHLATFANADFMTIPPRGGYVLYLDPPYQGTLGYPGANVRFDTAAFLQHALQFKQAGSHVFISEYDLPIGEVVFETTYTPTLSAGNNGRGVEVNERLYKL